MTVTNNHVTDCTIGVEVENSTRSVVRQNTTIGNTAGVVVDVLGDLPFPFTDNVVVEHNVVKNNNLPNPFAPNSGEDAGNLPTGTGILNLGGDHVVIRNKEITGNDSFGVGITVSPDGAEDPRIDTNPDNGQVLSNTILQNGKHPDPDRDPAPADIVYDASGTGTCFAANIFKIEFPAGVTEFFACP